MDHIIDSHAHCGIRDSSFAQAFEDYYACVKNSLIKTVVMFAPVMEIYDRHDRFFQDSRHWRQKREQANRYICTIGTNELAVIPYFFIWNDFAVSQITPDFKGIKWHRHASEPEYDYDSSLCCSAIADIRQRNMPVVLEEELHHTIRFITERARGIRVIIPHMGGLNGGYEAIKSAGLWQLPTVFADTALASSYEISDYISRYGHNRLLFGSDFPFGDPMGELEKVKRLHLEPDIFRAVTHDNITRLLSFSNP